MKGKLKFWIRYTLRELRHRQHTATKRQHRKDKISSRTRNIDQKDRKNLSEYQWSCRRRVTADTKYEGLHRWPHRDKIGKQLEHYIICITTLSWPSRPKRKRGITLTPEDTTPKDNPTHPSIDNSDSPTQLSTPTSPSTDNLDNPTQPSTPTSTPRRKTQQTTPSNSKSITLLPTKTDDRTLRRQCRSLLLEASPEGMPPTKKPRMLRELREDTVYALSHPKIHKEENMLPTKKSRMLMELKEDTRYALPQPDEDTNLSTLKRQKTHHNTPQNQQQTGTNNPKTTNKQRKENIEKTKKNKKQKISKKREGEEIEKNQKIAKKGERGEERGEVSRRSSRLLGNRRNSRLLGDGREGGSGDG